MDVQDSRIKFSTIQLHCAFFNVRSLRAFPFSSPSWLQNLFWQFVSSTHRSHAFDMFKLVGLICPQCSDGSVMPWIALLNILGSSVEPMCSTCACVASLHTLQPTAREIQSYLHWRLLTACSEECERLWLFVTLCRAEGLYRMIPPPSPCQPG